MCSLRPRQAAFPSFPRESAGRKKSYVKERRGYLVPPGDPTVLAEAMRKVMTLPPEERKRMGEAARRRVEEHFHIDRVVEKWEEIYERLSVGG